MANQQNRNFIVAFWETVGIISKTKVKLSIWYYKFSHRYL